MTPEDIALLRLRALLVPPAATLEPEHPPGWVWSRPLPPRRFKPGKGAAEPDDPEPETMAGGTCRWCHEPVDTRETGGDPDGGHSHLECHVRRVPPGSALVPRPARAAPVPPPKPYRAGDRCRHCRRLIDWSRDGAVAFLGRTYAHLRCYEADTPFGPTLPPDPGPPAPQPKPPGTPWRPRP